MKSKITSVNFNQLVKTSTFNKVIETFNRDGVVIIKKVLEPNNCIKLIKILNNIYSKTSDLYSKNNKSFSGLFSAKYVSNLHNKNEKFLEFLDYKHIHLIIRKLLQQGSYNNSGKIVLQANEARSPVSKAPAQQLHNDARIVGSKYPLVIQAMWALEDFKKNNGPTRFVLGSHKYLKFPQNKKKYPNEILATAEKGSVILFNGSVWHGSSEVRSDNTSRWAMIFRYGRWYLRPSFEFKENTPIKTFKKMNDAQKELLGFNIDTPKDEFASSSNTKNKFSNPINYKLPFKL